MSENLQTPRRPQYQQPGRYLNDAERAKQYKRRKKRRQRQRYCLFGSTILLLIVVIIAIVFLVKGCSAKTDSLAGTWNLDGTTTYEFDGNGTGAMVLPSISYDFTYMINGDRLVIDFANEILQDSTYTFLVEDGTLTMIGGEGTIGGTYELNKVSD